MTGAYEGEINQFKLIVGDKEYTPGFTLLPNNQFKLYIGKKIPPSIFSVTVKIFDKKEKRQVLKTFQFKHRNSPLTITH
ncbi:immunoglobulin-like domain-containing protein [Enterococcus hirae]